VLNLIKILKLKLNTFIKAIKIEIVKNGLNALLILKYKTYILKRILNRVNNNSKRDLILKNIIIVKRFYINIISKAKLLLIKV
jgi:hypothetical protein